MFIRRTKTRTVGTQDHYFTYRLVKSVRIGNKVRQRTLLNLGAHFDLPPAQWPLLYQRLDDLLAGQATLMDYPEEVDNHAQSIVAQLISRQAETSPDADDTSSTGDQQSVDVDSLQLVRPRTVGVEHVGLWAMEQVGLRGATGAVGAEQETTGSSDGFDHWPPGGTGFGTCDAPLAAPTPVRWATCWRSTSRTIV